MPNLFPIPLKVLTGQENKILLNPLVVGGVSLVMCQTPVFNSVASHLSEAVRFQGL